MFNPSVGLVIPKWGSIIPVTGFSLPKWDSFVPWRDFVFPNAAHKAYFVSWVLAKWPGSDRVGAEKALIDNVPVNSKTAHPPRGNPRAFDSR